jgi:uncharacterized repeat protein (TIGR03803 family)
MKVSALILAVLLLVAARPAQAQTEVVLYNFCSQPNCSDGGGPRDSLTFYGGNFYGTTFYGGTGDVGTVFELSPTGSGGWNQIVLYSFTGGADGANPYSNVIFDSVGNLYGTTQYGGDLTCDAPSGCGVAFELSPAGGGWTETVLHNFGNYPDGANPTAGMIFDTAGNLYGTTSNSVYELSPSGGGWTEQVIYRNLATLSGLTMDAAGNIFGVSSGVSVAFELSPNGSGGWTPAVIHNFCGPKDGCGPSGTLVFDNAGNLYGTTAYGGGGSSLGTVYKLSPVTKGKKKKPAWKEEVLHSFEGGTGDGGETFAGVVLDADGNIYGTTPAGGINNGGVVFELVVPVGKGKYQEKLLWSFNITDGADPLDSLILDSAGNLYGTTAAGGSKKGGVVFEVTP